MIAYFQRYHHMLLSAFAEHLVLVLTVLLISAVLASLICYLLLLTGKGTHAVVQICSVIYSIPSLALFSLMIPVTGLGRKTAIIVLVAYNQYLLIRNFMTGLEGVDPKILEAGTGMGMSRMQLITRVQLPLAMPSILAGLRLAIIATTSMGTIAATINAGGLGEVLLTGLGSRNLLKIGWGMILSIIIALSADISLRAAESRLQKKLGKQ
ncbi:MAG: ABC transporter permease [Lachnospiraceae bacterium]|nr:ABC transporter permease [Lachnospiraceae bacterium]